MLLLDALPTVYCDRGCAVSKGLSSVKVIDSIYLKDLDLICSGIK